MNSLNYQALMAKVSNKKIAARTRVKLIRDAIKSAHYICTSAEHGKASMAAMFSQISMLNEFHKITLNSTTIDISDKCKIINELSDKFPFSNEQYVLTCKFFVSNLMRNNLSEKDAKLIVEAIAEASKNLYSNGSDLQKNDVETALWFTSILDYGVAEKAINSLFEHMKSYCLIGYLNSIKKLSSSKFSRENPLPHTPLNKVNLIFNDISKSIETMKSHAYFYYKNNLAEISEEAHPEGKSSNVSLDLVAASCTSQVREIYVDISSRVDFIGPYLMAKGYLIFQHKLSEYQESIVFDRSDDSTGGLSSLIIFLAFYDTKIGSEEMVSKLVKENPNDEFGNSLFIKLDFLSSVLDSLDKNTRKRASVVLSKAYDLLDESSITTSRKKDFINKNPDLFSFSRKTRKARISNDFEI